MRGRRRPGAPTAVLKRVAVGASAGSVALGAPGLVLGAAVAASWDRIQAVRARKEHARLMDEQVPDALRAIGAAVRAGRSLPQALEAARDEAPVPIRTALDEAVARVQVGRSVDDAIEAFAEAAGTRLAAIAAETLRIGRSAGGDFPRVLDAAVTASSERLRIMRDRRAATSQARMSAGTVAAMPVAFYALVGSDARGRLLQMLSEPLGWFVVAAGLGLQVAGVLWMRALGRR